MRRASITVWPCTKIKKTLLIFTLCLTGVLQAEWRTENHSLVAGWNGIYLFVDASYASVDELLAGYPAIEEIWRWQPERFDPRLSDESAPPASGVEWGVWKRNDPDNSTFDRLHANFSYLIKLADGAGNLSLSVTGRPVLPEVRWRSDGLHLVGFPVNESGSGPRFTDYLSASGFSFGQSEIYRYSGGPIQNGVNPRLVNTNVSRIERGKAYWVNLGQFSRYYGPLRIELESGRSIEFGKTTQTARLLLTNLTEDEMTVDISRVQAESTPPGQPAIEGAVPLLSRFGSETSNTSLENGRTLTIPAGGKNQVQVILDRQALAGIEDDRFASVLRFAANNEEVFLAVTALKNSLAGLWYGGVEVDQVGSVLKRYRRDENGNTIFDDDGNPEIIEDLTTPQAEDELPGVARPYPLKLLVHVNASGQVTLLSHVYLGILNNAPANDPVGLTTDISLLDPASLNTAARISVAHLPLDTTQTMAGAFGPGQSPSRTLTVAHNDSDNPFVHTYHPDHDNLDARFNQTLPAGQESFHIVRDISISIDNDAPPGSSPAWGTTILTGTYSEDIAGIFKDTLRSKGVFGLKKISDIDTLTSDPLGPNQ